MRGPLGDSGLGCSTTGGGVRAGGRASIGFSRRRANSIRTWRPTTCGIFARTSAGIGRAGCGDSDAGAGAAGRCCGRFSARRRSSSAWRPPLPGSMRVTRRALGRPKARPSSSWRMTASVTSPRAPLSNSHLVRLGFGRERKEPTRSRRVGNQVPGEALADQARLSTLRMSIPHGLGCYRPPCAGCLSSPRRSSRSSQWPVYSGAWPCPRRTGCSGSSRFPRPRWRSTSSWASRFPSCAGRSCA